MCTWACRFIASFIALLLTVEAPLQAASFVQKNSFSTLKVSHSETLTNQALSPALIFDTLQSFTSRLRTTIIRSIISKPNKSESSLLPKHLGPFNIRSEVFSFDDGRQVPMVFFEAPAANLTFETSVQPAYNGQVEFRRDEFSIHLHKDGETQAVPFSERTRFQKVDAQHVTALEAQGHTGLGLPNNNVYLNRGYMVWSENKLYHAALDPAPDRSYDAFIHWTDGHFSIEPVRFVKNKDGSFTIHTRNSKDASHDIHTAATGIAITTAGQTVTPLENMADWDDLGHLFRFPEFVAEKSKPGKQPIKRQFGLKGLQGDAAGNNLRNALQGKPIALDLPIGAEQKESLLNHLASAESGYRRVNSSAELQHAGDYYLEADQIQIILLRSHYVFSVVGLTRGSDPRLVVGLVDGWGKDPRNASGLTPEEMGEVLRAQGVEHALVIAAGVDTRALWKNDQVFASRHAANAPPRSSAFFLFAPRIKRLPLHPAKRMLTLAA